MLCDEDCSGFYKKDTVINIIGLLRGGLDEPISPDEYKALLDQIPDHTQLTFDEVFEVIANSPISEQADTTANELYKEIVKESGCSCLPIGCLSWQRNRAVKDKLTKTEKSLKLKNQYMTRFKSLDDFDDEGKIREEVQDEIDKQAQEVKENEEGLDKEESETVTDGIEAVFKVNEVVNFITVVVLIMKLYARSQDEETVNRGDYSLTFTVNVIALFSPILILYSGLLKIL
jgi:hypothetical protein